MKDKRAFWLIAYIYDSIGKERFELMLDIMRIRGDIRNIDMNVERR